MVDVNAIASIERDPWSHSLLKIMNFIGDVVEIRYEGHVLDSY
jgi:hypothetical protein